MRQILDGAMPLSGLLWRLELGLRPVDTPERKADLQRRLDASSRGGVLSIFPGRP